MTYSVNGTTVIDGSRNITGASVAAGGSAVSGFELTITGAYTTGAPQSVSGSSIDASTGNYFFKTVTGSLSWSISNVPSSLQTYGFILELTNGGNGTQTWFPGTRWPSGLAPTLQVSGTDILVFITRDGGSTWRASLSQGASA